jgi:DNA (cytosine-5)-methyltransferase 1
MPGLISSSDGLKAPRTDLSQLVAVDCFSGAGGLSLGLHSAGIQTALAFDHEAAAVETYRHNLQSRAEVHDAWDERLPLEIESTVSDRPYILVGGPPCQGFSHQRRGGGNDDRNELVLRFGEIATKASTKPLAIVLENVTDLERPRGKQILADYTGMLSNSGYVVFKHVINSADFGVPQLRKRVIVIALQSSVAVHYKGLVPLTPDRWITVGEVLNAAPIEQTDVNHIEALEGQENKRRIAFVDMGMGRLSVPQSLQLPCHSTDYRGHRDVFGRLDWFSHARTVTSGFDSFTRGEYAHPFKHRSITAREAARIQGFPDWFQFIGTRGQVRTQIGNAVPPPLGFAIGTAVKAAILQSQVLRWVA